MKMQRQATVGPLLREPQRNSRSGCPLGNTELVSGPHSRGRGRRRGGGVRNGAIGSTRSSTSASASASASWPLVCRGWGARGREEEEEVSGLGLWRAGEALLPG